MTLLFEERIYEQALNEVNAGSIRAGLMAKAISESAGDKVQAMALYLRIRADAIQEEIKRCGLSASDRYLLLDAWFISAETIPSTKKYVTDEAANKQIHQVLYMFGRGASAKEIAGMFALRGVPCLKRGCFWTEALITEIITEFKSQQ